MEIHESQNKFVVLNFSKIANTKLNGYTYLRLQATENKQTQVFRQIYLQKLTFC